MNTLKALALAAVLLPTAELAAVAQDASIQTKIPTGYKVQGCTFYKLANGDVVQRCDLKTVEEIIKSMVDSTHPSNIKD